MCHIFHIVNFLLDFAGHWRTCCGPDLACRPEFAHHCITHSKLYLVRLSAEVTASERCSTAGDVVREEKKAFIRSKYEKRRYAIVTCPDLEDRRQDLKQAIMTRDMQAVLQVFAEGIDFMQPLPDMVLYRMCYMNL